MSVTILQTLSNGSTVVEDSTDGFRAVLRAGQYDQVMGLPVEERRAAVERFVLANRADPNPRTAADEQAMETAENAASGESHQEG